MNVAGFIFNFSFFFKILTETEAVKEIVHINGIQFTVSESSNPILHNHSLTLFLLVFLFIIKIRKYI